MINNNPAYLRPLLEVNKEMAWHQEVTEVISAIFATIKEELCKMVLYLSYYFTTSDSSDSDGKTLFKGGHIIAKAGNYGQISNIEAYLRTKRNPEFEKTAYLYGYKNIARPYKTKPYDGGICLGMSLQFASLYLRQGLDVAATTFMKGGDLQSAELQTQYSLIHKESVPYSVSFAALLMEYFNDPNQKRDLLFEKHEIQNNKTTRGLFAIATLYNMEGRPGSFIDFVRSHLAHIGGRHYMTMKRVSLLLEGKSAEKQAGEIIADEERILAHLAGLTILNQPHWKDAPKDVMEASENWEEGIYKITVPSYSNWGNETIFWGFFTLTLLGVATIAFGPTFFPGLSIENIGVYVSGVGVLGIVINKRKVFDGNHAVIFIKEKDRFILFDPNLGTGAHHNGKELLGNLFEFYNGDVRSDKWKDVAVVRITAGTR